MLSSDIDDAEDATVDEQEIDKLMLLMSTSCNEFKLQAIGYISGYVLRMIGRFVKCGICQKACLGEYSGRDSAALQLFDLKNRGPLQVPAKCVTKICVTTENAITLLLGETNANTLMKQKFIYEKIISIVMRKLDVSQIFPILNDHQFDMSSSVSLFDDHVLQLYRAIILCYCRIKFFHCVRIINDTNNTRIRQKLSRLAIFMNH